MGRIEKLLAKLKTYPKDLAFSELKVIMEHYGYKCSEKGRGSRVMFVKGNKKIRLHKPHPIAVLKQYQIKLVVDFLEKEENL